MLTNDIQESEFDTSYKLHRDKFTTIQQELNLKHEVVE